MEVLGVLLAIALVVCVVGGLLMLAAPFIGCAIAWLAAFWPFIFGCAIGLPLSLSEDSKTLGNLIVLAGLVGNVLWFPRMKRK